MIPAFESITNSSEIITSPEVGTAKEDCLFFGAQTTMGSSGYASPFSLYSSTSFLIFSRSFSPILLRSITCCWKRSTAVLDIFSINGIAPFEPLILPCSSIPFAWIASRECPARCPLDSVPQTRTYLILEFEMTFTIIFSTPRFSVFELPQIEVSGQASR